MKRFLALLILFPFANHDLRGDIPGYAVTTPALDAEIHPRLVSAAPNGNVWFAQQTTIPYSIGFFTPSGHVTNFPIPCGGCSNGTEVIYVRDLATASDSSVWFIDNHAKSNGTSIDSAIGHLTASGQFTFFAIPTKNGAATVPNGFGQSSIALAPDGTVWFTENATFKAGELTPSTGHFTEFPLESQEAPSGITVGPDGKVWYAVADHEIAQITPPSNGDFVEFSLASGSYPLDLLIGSDGNLWVTEAGRGRIARFMPSFGVVNDFELPTSNGAPQHIVSAPDGMLWYAEAAGMDVGRVTIHGESAPAFDVIATPGQQNFDITVSAGGIVYVTGDHRLLAICPNAPTISGPFELTSTRTFHGAFSISGKDPLNITVQNLPSSWNAVVGTATIIDSGAAPPLGTYTFTISVTDAQGCSIRQEITVHIIDYRHRSVRP